MNSIHNWFGFDNCKCMELDEVECLLEGKNFWNITWCEIKEEVNQAQIKKKSKR